MLKGDQVRRLYDALEGILALGRADRCRREYQSRAVRTPERRPELYEDLAASAARHVEAAVRLGLVASTEAWLAETEDELDRLLRVVHG